MVFNGWFTYGGVEIVNHARTVQLAQAQGISALRIPLSKVDWIEYAFTPSPAPYGMVENAPWYDAGVPASAEFAGMVALDVTGLPDSTLEAGVTEYITAGGSTGKSRHATLSMVWSVVLLASSERGMDYGEKWIKHVLRGGDARHGCVGPDLHYFGYPASAVETPPIRHRNRVKTTRGLSVTNRRSSGCSLLTTATFTMVAANPFEYDVEIPGVTALGGTPSGPLVTASGTVDLIESTCPVYDFSPVYDPQFPALIPPPRLPNMIPDGWGMYPGIPYRRHWVELAPVEPSGLSMVPVVTVTSTEEARQIRVAIGPVDTNQADAAANRCSLLWSAAMTYVPTTDLILDGENSLAYAWDGSNSRLANSLVYSFEATPMEWTTFNGEDSLPGKGLMVMLDTFAKEGGGWQGDGGVRVDVSFVPVSD